MSTDTAPAPSQRRRFASIYLVLLTVIALAATAVAGASLLTGPRVSSVLADPAAATTSPGSRVIFTANQPLAAVSPRHVEIEPDVPFTVDTAGRDVGIRFGAPLADGTRYEVTITEVTGISGGPTSTFSTTLQTPPAEAYLLERTPEQDRIYRTTLDGAEQTTVFEHPRIEDFRTSPRGLLVALRTEQGDSELVVVRPDGHVAEVRLPAVGRLARLQLSDSGDRFAYTWTDPSVEGIPLRDSMVFLGAISAPEAKPQQLELGASDPRIDDFRFVQGTTSLLLITRGRDLLLADPALDGEPVPLGKATVIDDVSRTEPKAYVRTDDGPEFVDLRDGSRSPAPGDRGALGQPFAAEEVTGRGTLLTYLSFNDSGTLAGQRVVLHTDAGGSHVIAEVPTTDAVMQVCAAPSGRWVGLVVAPDIAANTLDDAILAMPERVETRLISLETQKTEVVPGFAISWCRAPAI
ncbi:Ig-like domain-containing protein [Microbacterium cremeum]|uniref:Ig-like domain-containing protein n=1 Tax=Microbacterium cremeum TaxID=2782169 RepID=UPI0018893993|nr:Ig-like domain-containing protein [Microbacterium cremeum]